MFHDLLFSRVNHVELHLPSLKVWNFYFYSGPKFHFIIKTKQSKRCLCIKEFKWRLLQFQLQTYEFITWKRLWTNFEVQVGKICTPRMNKKEFNNMRYYLKSLYLIKFYKVSKSLKLIFQVVNIILMATYSDIRRGISVNRRYYK